MDSEIVTGAFGVGGVLLGGLVAWLLQKDRASADLRIALESVRTEHMAARAVRHFLVHKGYTDRSFELLKKRIGGFEEDELRRLLVRAGAVRYFSSDGREWWRLIDQDGDQIAKRQLEEMGPGNDDL